MTLETLIALCQPTRHFGNMPKDAPGALVQDSRKVTPGAVFIAVKGLTVDGHDYIENAIQAGAAVIICEDIPSNELQEAYFIQVENSRSLVGPLAQTFQNKPADQLTLIGITGTNGKTTVATLVYQVMQQLGAHISLLGTVAKYINETKQDSRLTTANPIELAADMRRMVDSGSTHLVMEVSSHALDQQRVNGISFDIAAFTNLSHDHLDYHKTVEGYAKAKKILFDGLEPKATAVINADDPRSELIASNCEAQLMLFGFNEKAAILCTITQNSSTGLTLQVDDTTIKSPLIGTFNAYNVAQAFLICKTLGCDKSDISRALSTSKGAPGRMESVQAPKNGHHPLVLVDYAHTPGALKNVLSTLAETKTNQQQLHVIFGCGGDRDKTKRPKMAGIAERFADVVTITSDNPRTENPDVIIDDAIKGFNKPNAVNRITDRREAITQVIDQADENTIILIAGKGHESYQEINNKRHPFNDRKIARQALQHRNRNTKKPEVN